jgi:hypothetical protein
VDMITKVLATGAVIAIPLAADPFAEYRCMGVCKEESKQMRVRNNDPVPYYCWFNTSSGLRGTIIMPGQASRWFESAEVNGWGCT